MFNACLLTFLVCLLLPIASSLRFKDGVDRSIIQLSGRWTQDYESDWSSSSFRFAIEKTNEMAATAQVTMTLNCATSTNTPCNFYLAAYLDNMTFVKKLPVNSTSSETLVNLELQLTAGSKIHIVEIYKITEPLFEMVQGLLHIETISVADPLTLVAPAPRPMNRRRVLFFGDSLTCGYGVEGTDPCPFSPDTENSKLAWAGLYCTNLKSVDPQAECQTVAWSGKGVVRNYGDVNQVSSDPTIPVLHNRTIATLESSFFKPEDFPADVIAIFLGSNDYSTQPQPSNQQFSSGYVDFLEKLSKEYHRAQFLCMCPMRMVSQGGLCDNIKDAISIVSSRGGVADGQTSASASPPHTTTTTTSRYSYIEMDPALVTGYGCSGHPNVASQQNLYKFVKPSLDKLLGF